MKPEKNNLLESEPGKISCLSLNRRKKKRFDGARAEVGANFWLSLQEFFAEAGNETLPAEATFKFVSEPEPGRSDSSFEASYGSLLEILM